MDLEDNNSLTGSEGGEEHEEQEDQSQPSTQFNADQAERVAEDAQRLVTGDLSENEFYQKYHQAYLEEFGIDNRSISPSKGADGTPLESALMKQISRRTLLKLGGITLAGILGARWIGYRAFGAEATLGENYDRLLIKEKANQLQQAENVQMGMVIDLEACDGCLDCVYACWKHNFNPPGVLWLYVLAYQEENRDGQNFLLSLCQHCGNPPCVKVCPVRARHKRDKDGLVLTDYNLCIGCRYCMVTCPYGVNYFQWDEPKTKNFYHTKLTDYRGWWVIGNPPKGCMGKCTFCPDRQDDGRANVVCELVCPNNVIHFGDINDPNSRPRRYLSKITEERAGKLSTFRLLEDHGTKPSIIYIGQQPSRAARPVEEPVSYEEWGLVEKRLPFLGGHEPWFLKAFGGSR